MPLQIVHNDITQMKVEAIVNAANSSLLGGGGVDGCIHRAAGPGLLSECRTLHGCETGRAKITGAYQLPCKFVIHTVGPVYRDGKHGEEALLWSCYRSSLELAAAHHCQSVAFPLISAGIFGYPRAEALRVAVDSIAAFLQDQDMQVYLVIFDRNIFQIGSRLYNALASFIDEEYVSLDEDREMRKQRRPNRMRQLAEYAAYECEAVLPSSSLEDALSQMGESFSQMVLRKIDEKHLSDAQCYKKANIDRKLFSKIRSQKDYKPSKNTALALGIALELPLAELNELLEKAGYALSPADKRDIIIRYFVEQGQYSVYKINTALFAFHEKQLGI